VIIHTIEARTHGRYLVEPCEGPAPLLVGFHGYGESADIMLRNLREIGEGWCLVSVQALHRFYTRKTEVVASWMTRQDREHEIADNTAYVWSVIQSVEREQPTRRPRVFAGFSQGVAMAYRAALADECDGLIVLAGDVPPDVAPHAAKLPPVLIGRGVKDEWYTAAKAAADLKLLRGANVSVTEHVFEAGHLWDPSFSAQARQFLRRIARYPE
jgi:predicted esterase